MSVSQTRKFLRWTSIRPRIAQLASLSEKPIYPDGRDNLAVVKFNGNRLELGAVGVKGGVRFAITAHEWVGEDDTPEVFFPAQQLLEFYREVKAARKIVDGQSKVLNGEFEVSYDGSQYEFRFVGEDGRIFSFVPEPYTKETAEYHELPQAPIFDRFLDRHTFYAEGFGLIELVTTARQFLKGTQLKALNYDPKKHTLAEYIRTLGLIIPGGHSIRFVLPSDVASQEYMIDEIKVHSDKWMAFGHKALEWLSKHVIDDFDGDVRFYLRETDTFRGIRPSALLILSPYFQTRLPLRLVNREEIGEALRMM